MRNVIFKVASHVVKVYIRGFAVVFTGCNIMEIYQRGLKKSYENVTSALFISAGWPATIPLICLFGASDRFLSLSVYALYVFLLLFP